MAHHEKDRDGGEFTAAQATEKAMAKERGWFMEDEKKPQAATASHSS